MYANHAYTCIFFSSQSWLAKVFREEPQSKVFWEKFEKGVKGTIEDIKSKVYSTYCFSYKAHSRFDIFITLIYTSAEKHVAYLLSLEFVNQHIITN